MKKFFKYAVIIFVGAPLAFGILAAGVSSIKNAVFPPTAEEKAAALQQEQAAKERVAAAAAEAEEKKKRDAAQAEAEFSANAFNSEWLDKKYGTSAAIRCGGNADSYLRDVSKYSFKWDDTGVFEQKFDKHYTNIKSAGVMRLASNKVSLQNGFGAFKRITLVCDFDAKNERVIGYDMVE